MPLNVLVPSLLRIDIAPSSSGAPHPLHEFLEPLLLTTRVVTKKYHVELPTILADGGGAGDIEETMMWFALEHEKPSNEIEGDNADEVTEPWTNDKWREEYLQRMERREYVTPSTYSQLQISADM